MHKPSAVAMGRRDGWKPVPQDHSGGGGGISASLPFIIPSPCVFSREHQIRHEIGSQVCRQAEGDGGGGAGGGGRRRSRRGDAGLVCTDTGTQHAGLPPCFQGVGLGAKSIFTVLGTHSRCYSMFSGKSVLQVKPNKVERPHRSGL